MVITAAPRRRPGYLAAAAVFAVGMMGTTLPTPLYGLYREEIGFSTFMVTVVFAVYAVGVLAVLLLAGNYSDRVGRRPVLLAAIVLSVLSALCFLAEHGLPLLFAGRLLSGFAAGLLSGTGTAAVIELAPPERRARAAFAATAANMGGLGCGPLLAGLLAQYAPYPLALPFLVHLALLVPATAVVLLLPETVERPRRWARPRPQGVRVPPGARAAFALCAPAAFAGFALLGLFTAVAPTFVAQTLEVTNHAVAGALVFSVFLASTLGQLAGGRLDADRALPRGRAVLVAGLALVAASLAVESLPLLVAGGAVAGFGQGMAFRAAVATVSAAAPAEQRGATISALFVIAYCGISLPVVGVGALTLWLGLRGAGLVFTVCVALTAAAGRRRGDRHRPGLS
ncbi:MFS transporter [Streptomyces sp. NPDC006529]|uniref:MFS transporter n=1 Tax=Streptomyces sp. NPDC006529 TaxID=3157177 RepID=UPI0033A3EC2F